MELSEAMSLAFQYSTFADKDESRKLGHDYYKDSLEWLVSHGGTQTDYSDWIELVHVFTINVNQLRLADTYLGTQHIGVNHD